jgi:hypothetical protein
MWLLFLGLMYVLLRWEHARIRMHGYLHFYTQANRFTRYGFFTAAMCTCSVSRVTTLRFHRSHSFPCLQICVIFVFYPAGEVSPSRSASLSTLITLENLALVLLWLLYVQLCFRFNNNRELPDAHSSLVLPASLMAASGMVRPYKIFALSYVPCQPGLDYPCSSLLIFILPI